MKALVNLLEWRRNVTWNACLLIQDCRQSFRNSPSIQWSFLTSLADIDEHCWANLVKFCSRSRASFHVTFLVCMPPFSFSSSSSSTFFFPSTYSIILLLSSGIECDEQEFAYIHPSRWEYYVKHKAQEPCNLQTTLAVPRTVLPAGKAIVCVFLSHRPWFPV